MRESRLRIGPMKLSRTVSYAVQATLQLAQSESDEPVPCSKLAAQGKMPERFLLQILRNLVTHGILRSTRGVDGGYALVRPADQISLLEVIEAIEGPYDSPLEVGEGLPEGSQHKLRDALEEVTHSTRRQLEAVKLSQLLKPPQAPASEAQATPEAELPPSQGQAGGPALPT
jgi:Rrf2 family transcriptional regulator, cysteine metabolism repressor